MQYVAVETTVEREWQDVVIEGVSGGSFRVRVGDKLTDKLEWDSSTSAMDSALQGIHPCSNQRVYREDVVKPNTTTAEVWGYRWSVRFDCSTASPFPLFEIVNTGLVPHDPSGAAGFNFFVNRTALASEVSAECVCYPPLILTCYTPLPLSFSSATGWHLSPWPGRLLDERHLRRG